MRMEAQQRATETIRRRISEGSESRTDTLISRGEKVLSVLGTNPRGKDLKVALDGLKRKRTQNALGTAEGEIDHLERLISEIESEGVAY